MSSGSANYLSDDVVMFWFLHVVSFSWTGVGYMYWNAYLGKLSRMFQELCAYIEAKTKTILC